MLTAHEIIDTFALRNASINGDEIICSCPFTQNHKHGDRHPSFGISVSKQVYNCFSCHESGSLVTLATEVLGMTRLQALEEINGSLTEGEISGMIYGREYEDAKPINPIDADVGRWMTGPRDYWYSRGFDDETIGKWRLGFDMVEQRATVPVYFKGELVGWTKRASSDSQKPKWTHFPGMPKGRILFGMDNSKIDSAILVEAPLSAIKLDQYGFPNAIASFGASLSDEQALLIRSHYNNVLIFYDPDDAGRRGTLNAIKKLEKFMGVYIVQPTRDDPAALTHAECLEAISNKPVIPSWAYV